MKDSEASRILMLMPILESLVRPWGGMDEELEMIVEKLLEGLLKLVEAGGVEVVIQFKQEVVGRPSVAIDAEEALDPVDDGAMVPSGVVVISTAVDGEVTAKGEAEVRSARIENVVSRVMGEVNACTSRLEESTGSPLKLNIGL